jgi:hypothetical protein
MNSLTIVVGAAADFPVQTWNRGNASKPVYTSADALTAYCYQGRSLTALFSPAVAWYTANSTQTGYDQGQVLLSITSMQAALLTPGGAYSVVVWWSPASQPAKLAAIVRNQLIVEAPQIY